MKKGTIIFIFLILVIGILFYVFTSLSKHNSTATSNENKAETIINDINNSNIPNNEINIKVPIETEVASFSTNLAGDSGRLNNINITCRAINGTIINPNETFSFNKIVGNPSPERGYQEADVIVETKVEKGYGGGNCQVSTTIYNICLQIPDIEIIERNPHKKPVTYVEKDKDAAISYSGGLDFKFKNKSPNPIKIYITAENKQVIGRIVKIT